ncbi:MAG: allantoinase AllB, partial [Vicinamibacterales bacterium]
AIHVRDGRVIGIVDFNDVPTGCMVDDVGDCAVLPGLVDPLVHVGGYGETASDAFARTTRAAAAGGVTTIIAMPFDGGVPTTSAAALESKCRAAQGHCFIDVGFWGGVVPGNQGELAPLFHAGALGFSCVLVASDADACSPVSEAELRAAMPALARLGAPLLVHAELPDPIDRAAAQAQAHRTWVDRLPGVGRAARRYTTYLNGRPKAAETEAIAMLIQLCQESRLPIHVAPLSSSDALTPIFHARSAGLPISATTCPHYLFFVADEVPNGAIEFKCAPPIRERENREFLWAALAGGLIQSVASDHRPALASARTRNFLKARSGIASLQLSLSVMWTEASARAYTLEQVVRWMCSPAAHLAGLARKGAIDVGYDADLVVFDSEAEYTVETEHIVPDVGVTPYHGRRLRGVVQRTYLRGTRVHELHGSFRAGCGRFLLHRADLRV